MSATIDTRIVEMKFDNTQFEAGIKQSLASLQMLEKGLKLDGAGKGIQNVATAAKALNFDKAATSMASLNGQVGKFSLTGAVQQVGQLGQSFSATSVAAVTALATIVSSATLAGVQIAKALSLKPALEGFSDYELKIGATQTIMAGTGESIGGVTKYLKELDTYADQTIYSLSDMVNNIGKFTNAGVKLPVAVNAMKGISNVAALSGASTNEAARAMYNLGQAIGQGKVRMMDWKSVELANMGTKEFKEQLIAGAVAMGTLKKAADGTTKTADGTAVTFKNFGTTLEKDWLTAEVLTKTLGNYADESTKLGKKAYAAAKDVKTFSMMMDTVKAAAGTGWTDTFDILIGNLPEAKAMWTDLSNVIGNFVQNSANARNKVLGDWKALGGRTAAIDAIKNAFHALEAVVKPIKDAFRQIFPATTGKQLADITKNIRDFMAGLQIGSETADKVKRAFAGVFAAFGIGWEIVKQVARVFGELFANLGGEQASGLLDIAANFGDFMVKLHDLVKNGKGVEAFFDGIRDAIQRFLDVSHGVSNIVQGFVGDFAKMLGGMSTGEISAKFEPFATMGKTIAKVWDTITGKLGSVWDAMSALASKFGEVFKSIGGGFSSFFGGSFNFDNLITVINTGLFAALIKAVRDFLKSLKAVTDDVGGIVNSITGPFDALTDTLKTMQGTLRAATLMQIAAAVGILTLSVIGLSKVDEKGLKRALRAMTIMFIELSAAMAIFQKIEIKSGMVQLIAMAIAIDILADAVKRLGGIPFTDLMKGLLGVHVLIMALVVAAKLMPDGKKMISSSIGMIAMATAVKILASAVSDMAGLSWDELARGLVGVGAVLAALTLFTKFSEANKGGIAQGVGLILLATGVKILASAMTDFAKFSWDEIARGLVAMGGGLAIMTAALMLVPPSSILSAAAILVVAASLGIIAGAMKEMGGMEWETIGKGLLVMASALTLIGAALTLIPPTSILSAAAIFVVASSLGMMTSALQTMGNMGWEEIAKGLVMLGGALTIIAVAVTAMALALPGAAALVIIVGALTLFLPVLLLLGNMSWAEIAKGLTMLAGTFLVIGVAGALLTPVIPTLMGLGIAISLLGLGMALAGAGLLAFSAGLTALAVAGTAGTAAVVAIVAGLIGLIPQVMEQIGLGIVAFAKVIATAGPAMTMAMTAVLEAIINSIIRLTPRIGLMMTVMLNTLLRILVNAIPRMVDAGLRIITGILNGIARNISGMVTAAANVIVQFLSGISKNLSKVIDAGVKLIIAFINGVADAIDNNSEQLGAAAGRLGVAVVKGMVKGISGGIGEVTRAAKNLASSALDAAKNALGIHSPSREFAKLGAFSATGYAKGLDGGRKEIIASANNLRAYINAAMKNAAGDIKTLSARLDKLKHARKKDNKAIRETAAALAAARVEYAKASKASKIAYSFGAENKKLLSLADQQAKNAVALDGANKKLADAIKTRDDYNKSIKDSFSNLPDIADDTKLPDYIENLQKQVVDTQIFTAQLQKLRSLGLNDEMYKELLSKGTSAIPFVTQILEGGQNSVTELNTLGSALSKSAGGLADTASKALYQAGVDAAAGLVKGLQNQQKALEAQMDKLASAMVKSIKKALGIKSPSREFMKVGDWSAQGLAEGLKKSTAPLQAAEQVSHGAIDAMRKSLTGLSDLVGNEVSNINPSIRPVLDLTEVKKDAGRIGNLLTARPLEVSGAYSQARETSSALRARREADYEVSGSEKAGTNLTFIQNNNSPKEISAADTYRNTNNQLSRAKGALAKTR